MKALEKELTNSFSMSLRANSVEAGPPLSTILGNFGVNTTKFCTELNNFTKELPNYFLLEVRIDVFSDRTYTYSVMEPTTSFLLRLVSFNKDILVKGSGGFKFKPIKAVNLSDIYLVSKFKYGLINNRTLSIVFGTLSSMDLYVVK